MSKITYAWCGILIICGLGCGLLAASHPLVSTQMIITVSPSVEPVSTFEPALPPEATPGTKNSVAQPTRVIPAIPTVSRLVTPGGASFQGSVLLQQGMCCIGGIVGTVVDLRKDFAAQSAFGPVTEMRRKEGMSCFTEVQMSDTAWEPFIANVTEPFAINAINWVGHYISVQYRDSLGNLSAVACDDISVEGLPAPPSPSAR